MVNFILLLRVPTLLLVILPTAPIVAATPPVANAAPNVPPEAIVAAPAIPFPIIFFP
ncbi:Uncharacterised protein [Chlamydia trachomatis]|nr:Uncharacterised protein [Chlamydia trachomatis]